MIAAAEKAAASLMADYTNRDALTVEHKGAGDFVSQADKKAETVLFAFLQEKFPEWGFVGEEGADTTGSDARYRWIIDPLDGTTNFLQGIPYWAVSVGLEFNGEMIAGVVYDAVKKEIFAAEKGKGAYLNGKRIHVSDRTDLGNAMVAVGITGTRASRKKDMQAHVAKINEVCADLRRFAACSLDMSYVACGRLDAYAEYGVKPWDLGAGVVIVREAGGLVTDLSSGTEMFTNQELLCGNPAIHAALTQLFEIKTAKAA